MQKPKYRYGFQNSMFAPEHKARLIAEAKEIKAAGENLAAWARSQKVHVTTIYTWLNKEKKDAEKKFAPVIVQEEPQAEKSQLPAIRPEAGQEVTIYTGHLALHLKSGAVLEIKPPITMQDLQKILRATGEAE